MANGNFTFEINERDWAALQKAIYGLSKIDGNQAIMNSLSKGMLKLTTKGKTNLTASGNKKTGNLLKSIRRKRVKKWMSVYGGFKRGKGGGNHAHLIDRGTNKRWTKKGYYRGSVSKDNPNKGNMFWTNAANTEGPKIMQVTMNTIYKEIDKIMRKKK